MPDVETQTEISWFTIQQQPHDLYLENFFLLDSSSNEESDTEKEELEVDSEDSDDIESEEDLDCALDKFYLLCSTGDVRSVRNFLGSKQFKNVITNENLLYAMKIIVQLSIDNEEQLSLILELLELLNNYHQPPLVEMDSLLNHAILYAKPQACLEDLLHFLLRRSVKPKWYIRSAVKSDKHINILKQMVSYALIQGYQMTISELTAIIDNCVAQTSQNSTMGADIRLAVLISLPDIIYFSPSNDADTSNKTTLLLNLIISENMIHCLDAVLSHQGFDPVKGLTKCGVFQDTIEQNKVALISRWLQDDRIYNFYKDIVANLLSRNSKIIKSKEMSDVLYESLRKQRVFSAE